MTNRDDKPSSDELIRRARHGIGSDSAVDARVANTPPSPAEPAVRSPISPAPFPGEETSAGRTDVLPPPPSVSPGDAYPTMPPPAPPRPAPRGIFARFGGWILIGVLALGGFAWLALNDTKAVEDLAVGECIDEPDEEILTSIETVDCDELHDYEVFQVIEVPYTNDASYPGDDALFWEVLDICVGYFSGFVGMDYADSIYDINAIYPTQESWDEQNDREATCLIAQYNSVGTILPVTGSLRGVQQ